VPVIFNDLCEAAKKWHTRSTTNVSTTIYGCSIVVLVSIEFVFCTYIAFFSSLFFVGHDISYFMMFVMFTYTSLAH
jgi:hypothetical protein